MTSCHSALFVILGEAGYSVRREARGVMPMREGDKEGRVMDLVAADPQGGPRLLIDVTVADPLRTPAESAVDRGHAARVAEGLKQAKYHDHAPDDTLIPAAVETFGCLGAPFLDLLRTCARRAAASRARDDSMIDAEASRMLSYYRQRISVSLQRSHARTIHHRSARAVYSTLGARPLARASGYISRADLYTISRSARFVGPDV